ncbi:hypothetical protein J3R30DRAFT_3682080 [Lentinula aciculospora]|uniref:Uncharacterized protein n=1 Tax=Lentinula aciculospora TaxID=153920 RepID=A0A9W9DPL7_9AGAR|nr:hypothetical protein J3R30DRAFT_3682080 [Lentinula aciculospora]
MKKTYVLVLALAVFRSVYAIEATLSATSLSATSSSSSITTSSPTTSSSSSTSSASASASPTLEFDLSSTELNTCSSFTINWSWGINGKTPPKGLTLSVTNINVTQQVAPASSTSSPSQISNTFSDSDTFTDTVARRGIIPSVASGSVLATGTISAAPGSSTPLVGLIESLSTTLDPSAQSSYTWNQVNLPQGWYEFLATPTDAGDVLGGVGGIWSTWNVSSTPIFIWNSSDTSCLAVISTSTSTSSSGATNTAGQSPSAGGSLSATSHVNSGAIAGGVIGGSAALVAIICSYIMYLRGRRYKKGIDAPGDGNFPKPNFGKWGALGSFDSANGSRSTPKAKSKPEDTDKLDPLTVLNTAANTRPPKSGGFGLGDMGLAALGLSKSQDSPPSAFTTKSKRDRRSRQAKHSSGTTESAGAIMSSSFSSSSFSPSSSSAHGHYDPSAEVPRGYSNTSTKEAEEEFGYSPHEQRGVPMRDLSPSSSPTEEGYLNYQPYLPSTDSLSSGAPGVGTIPIGYEASPFVTPPPSEPASRHNSRSYSRSSLATSNYTQAFAALGISDSSNSDGFRPNRARSQSQNASPTSPRALRGPDVPESPKYEFSSTAHNKRASSPDAFVYTLNPEQTQSSSSASKGQTRRTPRKPVPSYVPDEALGTFTEMVTSPTSPVYTYSGTVPTRPAKAATSRRPAPTIPPSDSASSSSSSIPAAASERVMHPYGSHLQSLEHKESAQSLASLRNMEGDLSAYGAVLGNENIKQMHVLIPDMPLAQK